MIREYAVVNGALLQDVVDDVNKRIGEGWQPIGGICVVPAGRFTVYAQAVVFEAPAETVVNINDKRTAELLGEAEEREYMADTTVADTLVRDAGGA